MSTPILATKLYIPPPRPKIVLRPRLIKHLNEGVHRKLTLISASAGFGKTTLVSEWIASCGQPVAWLSLACVLPLIGLTLPTVFAVVALTLSLTRTRIQA